MAFRWLTDGDPRLKFFCSIPACIFEPGPETINPFSCLNQLTTKFKLLIISKISTNEEVSGNIMAYLLGLKLKLSSAANYRWRFMV